MHLLQLLFNQLSGIVWTAGNTSFLPWGRGINLLSFSSYFLWGVLQRDVGNRSLKKKIVSIWQITILILLMQLYIICLNFISVFCYGLNTEIQVQVCPDQLSEQYVGGVVWAKWKMERPEISALHMWSGSTCAFICLLHETAQHIFHKERREDVWRHILKLASCGDVSM